MYLECSGFSFRLMNTDDRHLLLWRVISSHTCAECASYLASASIFEVCSSAALWSRHRTQQSASVKVVGDTEGVSGGGSVCWAQLWTHRENNVCLSLTCLSLWPVCFLVSVLCLWTLLTLVQFWAFRRLVWRCVNVHGVIAALPVRSVLLYYVTVSVAEDHGGAIS